MENKINIFLSDLITEYHKLQNYHWYVKGAEFFNVHAKLEEYYDAFLEVIDEVAETMLMNDLKPVASMKQFLEITSIKEANVEYVTADKVLNDILADFEHLKKSSIEIKELADSEGNYQISGLMDGYISNFAKNIWMLKQFMMK